MNKLQEKKERVEQSHNVTIQFSKIKNLYTQITLGSLQRSKVWVHWSKAKYLFHRFAIQL